jgi:hypothetical protein
MRAGAGVLLFASLCTFLTPIEAAQPGPGVPSVVKVFNFKFKKAEDAAVAVRPFLSEDGSVLIQPKANSLTVQDQQPAIDRISRMLAKWDAPPRGRSLAITLLKATTTPHRTGDRNPLPDEIKVVAERLKKLFNFQDFTPLDSVVVRGLDGNTITCVMGGGYQLEFLLEPGSEGDLVRLRNLSLSTLRKDQRGAIRSEILRTSINVPVGQPYVLGVGKDEAAQAALFLVFFPSAVPAGPGPGLGGER